MANAKTAVKPKPALKRQHFVRRCGAVLLCRRPDGHFSFFINYIATDIPALRQNAAKDWQASPMDCTAAH